MFVMMMEYFSNSKQRAHSTEVCALWQGALRVPEAGFGL